MTPRDFARSLRKEPSSAERALWKLLRDKKAGAKFRRQHPVPPYTADFACIVARLIIEVDGPSHTIDEHKTHDVRRTKFLEAEGWRVLRLRDVDVLADPSGVTQRICAALSPSP